MLTYAHGCSRMLTYGDGWSRCDTATDEAIRAGISAAARVIVVSQRRRILTYAHVCWRMLAYADVC
jgi:hypothetical protein